MDFVGSLIYLATLALLVPFGTHRLRLLWLRFRRPARSEAARWDGPLPHVTVQLPIYNEANVVERLIDAACSFDYPTDRLEIQVLDDSDDETTSLAAQQVKEWRSRGIDIRHVRRSDREGFKAGALAYGTNLARGEFLLVLDADFVPPSDLIRRLLPPFSDENVGAVQAAWDHLDRGRSWLTRAQALFLDAHFAIEHEARYRANLFFNFNGSAGIWRRQCIEDAGGWHSDTLTEDVDLSYRAQLAGWRFAFLGEVRVGAELPLSLSAVEVQQSRWTQGGIQNARKLLPRVWNADLPLEVKLEATAHLFGHVVHPLTLMLGVTIAAAGWVVTPGSSLPWWVHLLALAFATLPFMLFYGTAGCLRQRGRLVPRQVLEAMLLGLGLGVPLTVAVARGFRENTTPFVRTPKEGFTSRVGYQAPVKVAPSVVRALLTLALVSAIANIANLGLFSSIPFTALFALGYLLATGESLRSRASPTIVG